MNTGDLTAPPAPARCRPVDHPGHRAPGWLYVVAGVAGEQRRTIYDEWAQVVVLAPPPS